jgi:hypothetical protein
MEYQPISFDNLLIKPKPKLNIYDKNYSHTTLEYYKAIRLRKMDPITMNDINTNNVFEFKFMWDPYTGERLGEDPIGPLYFEPENLIKYYYTNRLNGLWVDPIDNSNGYYEGYYDDNIGCGEEMFINGRGYFSEKYLFRLPIIDCYLTNDHKNSIITMGPKLTDKEIILIEELANKQPENYKKKFGKNKPNLIDIKKLYDQAIFKLPKINDDNYSKYYKINKNAVDLLIKIDG